MIRRLYNKNKTLENKYLLNTMSKEYKNVIKQSISRFKTEKINKLKNLKNAKPREFWKIINSVDKKENNSNVPLEDLYKYFKEINAEQYNDEIQENNESSTQEFIMLNEEINQAITANEIFSAIKSLKNNKSSWLDNILNEHIKCSANLMLPVYTQLFNLIFDTSLVPNNWILGNILPIYKNKGDKHMPQNYRPITLLSCFGKLFTAIINNRLTKYADQHELISSCQAGFRKGFSTIENLFVINSLTDILKAKSRKLYCAYIDFKQAFDKIWRQGLWAKMMQYDINGKCNKIIKKLYENIKSKITTNKGSTAYFPCNTGVRQGENLSPFLFNLYLNDLEAYLHQNKVPGITCETDSDDLYIYLKIFILLYADDTVILSESRTDLQLALNVFGQYCAEWKLTVNTDKTKILIFAKDRLSKYDKYYFNGKCLEIVNEYKYLGIIFSRSGSFARTKKYLSDQANKAMFSLLKKIRVLNLPISMQIELFNKTIKPILLYGAEIYGFGNLDILERIQLKFLKYILNLKASTPTAMVYGETGIMPLKIDIQSRLIAFWTKITDTTVNQTKLSTNIYLILKTLCNEKKCKSPWLENVKNIIHENGFGHVWLNQHSFNRKWFNLAFKQKLKDQYIQNWLGLVNTLSSSNSYQIYKGKFRQNLYFSYLNNKQIKVLTAFRTRNHKFPIEVGRWKSIPISERSCHLCNAELGDEFHYLFQCQAFENERKLCIKPYFVRRPNILKFNQLMNTTNKSEIRKLCKFIEHLLKSVKAVFI